MSIEELKTAIQEGKRLVWNDPDPISGNDYTVQYILWDTQSDMLLIHYGEDGETMFSEAEVLVSELSFKL